MILVLCLLVGMVLGMGLKEVLKATDSYQLKYGLPIAFLVVAIGVGLTGRYMPLRIVATCAYALTAVYSIEVAARRHPNFAYLLAFILGSSFFLLACWDIFFSNSSSR